MLPLDYFLFMAEAEGCDDLVDTHPAKINAAVRELIDLARKNINVNNYITPVLEKHGLSEDTLTPYEKNYIMNQIDKYFYIL